MLRNTDYEYLHLMQHYGLPTRLLDWTEGSLIALFFAIHKVNDCDQPTVWIIDLRDFNHALHKDQTIFYFYGNSVHPKINSYLNPAEYKGENLPSLPIAVLPSFYDDRVIGQKSGFILFGKDKISLEELVKREHYFNMARINIDTAAIRDILVDLNIAGINYHTVFPDLYGLVEEIKFKWDIK